MLNRAALILKYKEPAIQWINGADPCNNDPGITIESVNEECTVYLISNQDADSPDAVDRWIKRNWQALFETELEGWYTDPDLWPKTRTLKLFHAWFTVECHTVVCDTVGGEIYDDDI